MKLYVLTCERPGGVTYVVDIVRALNRQQWSGERVLWSDGPAPESIRAAIANGEFEQAPVWRCESRPRRGPPNTFAFFDMLEDAASRTDEDVLFVEDDVAVSRGFLPYVERMGCPDPLSYITWFETRFAWNANIPAFYAGDASEILSSQARTISARAIRRLLEYKDSALWRPEVGLDACMAEALSGQTMGVHFPSLVQHRGMVSAANPGSGLEGRRSLSWLGDTFDAMMMAGQIPKLTAFLANLVAKP